MQRGKIKAKRVGGIEDLLSVSTYTMWLWFSFMWPGEEHLGILRAGLTAQEIPSHSYWKFRRRVKAKWVDRKQRRCNEICVQVSSLEPAEIFATRVELYSSKNCISGLALVDYLQNAQPFLGGRASDIVICLNNDAHTHTHLVCLSGDCHPWLKLTFTVHIDFQ